MEFTEELDTELISQYIDLNAVCRICLVKRSEMYKITSSVVDDNMEHEYLITDLLVKVFPTQVINKLRFVK